MRWRRYAPLDPDIEWGESKLGTAHLYDFMGPWSGLERAAAASGRIGIEHLRGEAWILIHPDLRSRPCDWGTDRTVHWRTLGCLK